ncbi:MAG: Mrp/NBP35 family ATP-binding protein [Lachnospiraceae bacterium]|nr:Mrp/NBP35 family ATP-binding protein [Lachnospiraceae bacterium]
MSENNKEGKIPMPTPNFKVDANPGSHVKKMIAVVSGKGGVGKSSVTGMCAMWSVRKGYRTGILDADVTGPSIPKMFGVGPEDVSGTDQVLYPAQTQTGIKIMSMNLLMTDENQPVVWRAPVITGAIKQFWTDVEWGDVDYMFVDMPPGTGDVPLTVFQSLPIDGIIVVTTPQDLVSMIVKKAVNMAKIMNVPILGIVENMSYVRCPHCGEEIHIFGESQLEKIAEEEGLKVIGRLPIDPALTAACDSGLAEYYENEQLEGLDTVLPALE